MGEAIALRLSDEDINVVVFDIRGKETLLDGVVKKVEAKGKKAFYFIGDVTVEKDVEDVVAKTVATFGGLDIVSYRTLLCNDLLLTGLIDGSQRRYSTAKTTHRMYVLVPRVTEYYCISI